MSPYAYITSFTRKEFEVDVTGWVSSIFFPVGQIMRNVLGSPDDKGKSRPQSKISDHDNSDTEAGRRSRRSSKKYSWYRQANGRSYNIHNLDASNTEEAGTALSSLRKEFASQGK